MSRKICRKKFQLMAAAWSGSAAQRVADQSATVSLARRRAAGAICESDQQFGMAGVIKRNGGLVSRLLAHRERGCQ